MNNLYEKKGALQHLIHAGLSALFICLVSAGLVAQTFPTPTSFTLPAGKTIVITYDVDVNANACAPGTIPPANLSNQASVTGSFFGSPKLTDDPAFPGAMDPTLTPFAGLVLGNLVYNDVNRNGVFDGGDTGINSVALNLYLDVNSNNMLDAGDGAAVATATTANMSGQDGRYAFSVCPGTYIVQVAPSNFNMGGALYNMGVPFVSSPLTGAGDPDIDVDDNDDNGDAVSGFGVATAAFTISADNNNIDFGFKTPTGISINDVTMNEGTGGTTTSFNFTVTRTSMEDAINLTVNTTSGTAASPGDFAAISGGTVSFPAGMAPTQTVTVLVNHDNMVEPIESFTVVLSGAPAHANITDNSGLGSINNDDDATVTLSAAASQNEGNSGSANYTFTATLNNPVQGGFSIAYTTSNNSATAGSDYTDNDGSLLFTGNSGEEQFIQVPILGDMVVELDETFTVALGTVTGAPAGVTAGPSLMGAIANDDAATVTISNVSQVEGNGPNSSAFAFTVTLNGQVDVPVNVNFMTVDGTATIANNDYQMSSGAISAFTANGGASQTRIFNIQVVGDVAFESNETFLVRLSALMASGRNVSFSPAGTTLDGTGTILNDDIPPVIINEVDADQTGTDMAEFIELYDGGVGNTNLNGLVLVFYNGSNDLSYRAIDLDGFTTDANGYFLAANPGVSGAGVTFPNDNLQNGQDAVALYMANATDFPTNTPVTLTNLIDAVAYDTDDADDPGLLVLLNAGQPQVNENGGGNSACHSIQRIPNGSGGPRNTTTYQALPPTPKAANFVPEVSISVSPLSILEDGSTDLTYTISRTGSTDCDLAVTFTVSGSAASGADYPAISASPITIPAGSATTTIVVNPNTDNTVELDETVIITLTDGALYDLGTSSMATGTITNDDNTTLTLSHPAGPSLNEGNSGATPFTYRITLSNPVQGGFRVNYTTNDGTATTADNDYTDNDGFVDFTGTAGEFQEFTVNVTGDTKVEADETIQTEMVSLSLISVSPATVSFSGSPFTSTILNDDAATLTIVPVSQNEGTGGTTDFNFAVTLNPAVQGGFGLNFLVNDGTATDADDFDVITTSPLAFAGTPGETHNIVVRVGADNKVEANEIFTVQLVSLSLVSVDPFDVTFSGSPATGTLQNDDAATVTLTPAAILMQNEGNTGTTPFVFTATLNNPVQGGFTLPYTTNDLLATTANNDYQDNDGTLTFAGTTGEAFNITVLVNGDLVVEANEGFDVVLGAITGAPAGVTVVGSPQMGLILNDEIDFGDAPDSYGTLLPGGARHGTSLIVRLGATSDGELDGQPGVLADGDDTDLEGDDDDGVTLPSALVVNTTANISIEASINGFVNGWVDFNQNGNFNEPGELIFNQQAVVAGANDLSFAVPADATLGASYARFRFTQSAVPAVPTGLQTTGEVEDYAVNITNTQFSINDPVAINEGNTGTTDLIFTVTRSNTSNACSVEYSFTGGTATLGDGDYTVITPSPISFTAGGSPTAPIIVRVNGDTKVELNETVEISLSNPVNGSILDELGVGTINNDDAAILSITNPTVTEGDAGTQNMTFGLSLSNPSDANVVVNFSTMNGTATTADLDYQNNSGSHTFTPGQTTKQVVVLISGDCKIEPNETFAVHLNGFINNGRNVSLSGGGATLDGTGTIVNDDALPVLTCPMSANYNTPTGQCNATVTLPLPVSSSICGSSSLQFRHRAVDAMNTPTGSYSGYAPTSSNTVAFSPGRYEIEWQVMDASGSSTCSYFIEIIDNEPPTVSCTNQSVTFNGQSSMALDVNSIVSASDNCGVANISLSPASITCEQSGQAVPVVVTVTDLNGNIATCTAMITVAGLPCGWSQNPDGVGCAGGSSNAFNPATGVFTTTSTNCFYGPPYTSDATGFAQRTLCGDGSITAQVTSINGNGWAGVVMRESNAPGAKKAQLLTNLSTFHRREFRTTNNAAAQSQQSASNSRYWLRITRAGNQFTLLASANGISWFPLGAQTIVMDNCIQMGMIASNFTANSTVTATFGGVSFTGNNAPLGLPGNGGTAELAAFSSQLEVDFSLHPNPTNGELNVDLTAYFSRAVRIELYSLEGKLIQFSEIDEVQNVVENLNLSEYSNGMYLVKVKSDGLPDVTRRVVVTR